MNIGLCKAFPALTPFSVRREKYREVITTYKRMIDRNSRDTKSGGKGKGKVPEGSFVCNGTLYKPAQNDDWY